LSPATADAEEADLTAVWVAVVGVGLSDNGSDGYKSEAGAGEGAERRVFLQPLDVDVVPVPPFVLGVPRSDIRLLFPFAIPSPKFPAASSASLSPCLADPFSMLNLLFPFLSPFVPLLFPRTPTPREIHFFRSLRISSTSMPVRPFRPIISAASHSSSCGSWAGAGAVAGVLVGVVDESESSLPAEDEASRAASEEVKKRSWAWRLAMWVSSA
jgi:hypothetical protein